MIQLRGPALVLLVGACATPSVSVPVVSHAAPPSSDDLLGSVDGVPVRRSELSTSMMKRLSDMQNEHLQRTMHLQWAGFEEAVDRTLLAKEAKRRSVSVEELRAKEIDAKVTPATDDEAHVLYDENAGEIQVAFEVAAPYIKKQLDAQKREGAERALAEQLRKTAEVRYALPVPDLPRIALDPKGAPSEGPDAAKVTLVEFSDFQCPYCARARSLVAELREAYPDALRVVYRDFPLSQHPQARAAAEAAQCAGEQNKFWPYHDLLFDNQHALSSADLKKYASDLALDLGSFDKCLLSDRPGLAVKANEELGHKVGVEGTPALFLNGMKLIGVMPLPLMKLLIDRELEKSRGGG